MEDRNEAEGGIIEEIEVANKKFLEDALG